MRKITLLLFVLSPLMLLGQGYQDKVRALNQFGLPYFYNEGLEANINKWKANENNVTSDILGLSILWFKEMETAQKASGLPWFVKYIPAANTAYNHLYDGTDGSKGMWPLSFAIGKKYGLTQNSYTDMRRDVEASSVAACKYLAELHNIYKDWPKTITAFRIGAIRLNQAIRLAGNSLDFNDIYAQLTPEEKEPVLQFYTAVVVMYFRHDFHIQETVYTKPDTDTATTSINLPFGFLEEQLGVEKGTIKNMNPQFTKDLVPAFGGVTWFKLPLGLKPYYESRKDSFPFLLHYVEPELPVNIPDSIVSEVIADTLSTATVAPTASVVNDSAQKVWVWYRIKRGDTYTLLADIYDCSIEDIRQWNGLRYQELMADRLLKFYVSEQRKEYYKNLNTLPIAEKQQIAAED